MCDMSKPLYFSPLYNRQQRFLVPTLMNNFVFYILISSMSSIGNSQNFISKALILFSDCAFSVHDSQPYVIVAKTIAFMNLNSSSKL